MKRPPRWSFEHARRSHARTLAATMGHALRPLSFWRDLRMSHLFRPGRLLIYALATLVLAYLVLFATNLTRHHGWRDLLACLTGDSSRRTQRGWSMDSAGDTVLALLHPIPDRVLYANYEWRPNESEIASAIVLGWMLLLPLSYRLLPATLRRAKVRRAHFARIFLYGTTGALLLLAALPLLAEALRALVPSLIYPSTPGGRTGPLAFLNRQYGPGFHWWLAPGLAAAWLLLWWDAATRRYLHLPHTRWVALSLWSISGLLVILLWLVTSSPETREIMLT